MVSIPTTAPGTLLIAVPAGQKASFIIHADSDNTDTVNVSHDSNVTQGQGFEELLAGQSIAFEDYQGAVYAQAEGSAQNVYVVFPTYSTVGVQKST